MKIYKYKTAMNQSNHLILSTTTKIQPTGKPRNFTNLAHRQRSLYGRTRLNNAVKELDSETGLYYYGARYLDPKTSRWLSGDPAVGEYIPSAPVNDEARKRNGSLPGMGGVFNYVNLHVYHYAGNNPVKLVDPDGRDVNSFKNLFLRNDKSTKIFTIGYTFSETMMPQSAAAGFGLYINPKNDDAFLAIVPLLNNPITASLAISLLALNIEDIGYYGELALGGGIGFGPAVIFGTSASATITIGVFNSVEEFAGLYSEGGFSVSFNGFTGGLDIVRDLLSGEYIGTTVSAGLGVGSAVAEIHTRVGVTGAVSILNGVIPLNDD